ncbi:agmatinase family protein [Bacillus aquiflavi]|uniref:Agmatinase family protein n=1 Tax=Bacillus aquiflavi TaxID=2672567 RepID=A0A6B3VVM9_9BACI|nr:agmatinase family protein [Bacillus aquiflavi]MBA4535962.1 agmatinase family protein [Bacillus aquiflavi]NEY80337.1 agmatinase family protein [Bacillus aquiflavi]UAC49798.1 agmatinase family protein [Bacillus aquiflavi]
MKLPISPPTFYWPKQAPADDVKVHEWIKQPASLNETVIYKNWDAILFGVPLSRSSISVSGASEFPEAFRRSWNGFSTYNLDDETELKDLKIADIGDVSMHFTNILKCHRNIKETMLGVRQLFPKAYPIAIGGDHSITAMLVAGLKEAEPTKEIGILQFDTHFDLRSLADHGPTNGTPIRNLIESGIIKGENVYNIGLHGFYNSQSLISYAKEHRVQYVTMKQVRKSGIKETVKKALHYLQNKVDTIYVTVDMDVLDIGFAPGVPASTPGGMRTDELFEAVYLAGAASKVKALDIVCLDPTRDEAAKPTVKAGTYTFLSFLTGVQHKRSG